MPLSCAKRNCCVLPSDPVPNVIKICLQRLVNSFKQRRLECPPSLLGEWLRGNHAKCWVNGRAFFSGNCNAMLWPHFHKTSGVRGMSFCPDRLEGDLTFSSGETRPRFKSQDQVMRLTGVKPWTWPQRLLDICAFTQTKPARTSPQVKKAKSSNPQNFSTWHFRKLILKLFNF